MYLTIFLSFMALPLSLQARAATRRRRYLARQRLDLALRTIFTGCYPATAVPAAASTSTAQSLKFLVAGAIGGIISRTLVSPLEVVATVNMASEGAVGSVLEELSALWASEGIVGFFKGNGANCLKVAPTKGIQFVTFECLKRFLGCRKWWASSSKELNPFDRLITGGMAGVVAAASAYPLETLKSVLTVERRQYGGSIIVSFVAICKDEGVFALYRGLAPTLIAMMPYVGVEFCVYETIKELLVKHYCATNSLSTIQTMLIGAAAGAVAQTSCHPLDVVRKRLQLQGLPGRPTQYSNMLDALACIVCFPTFFATHVPEQARVEGVRGLYKGLAPACLATLPSTGSSYVVYEALKAVLGVASR
mmetsp:Transcript_4076/g.13384  ORF Transcript_4076/g.13384 Transcript_4076/m.13384 type:complete len:363 (-) Transcript_4076:294-1382(-)